MTAVQRVLLLWCPDWPITAVIRSTVSAEHSAVTQNAPIALIEAGAVFACSAAARADGVRRGLRVREAQARCPDLIVLPYRAEEDARAYEPVLTAIEELTPGVQPLRPGVCAIRARGPAEYYGGEEEAALWLLDQLDDLGVPNTRVGVADGVFTAEQAARSAWPQRIRIVPAGESAAFLAPLPIGVLDTPPLTTLLRRLGLYTLGAFSALPADDVLDRFGEQGARLHALAGGLDSRPVSARVPPDDLDCVVEFEPSLDRVDQVAFGVRAMADRFIAGLVAAKLVCTAVRVELDTDGGQGSQRTWLHPRSFTAAEVVDRVRWQLQGGGESRMTAGVVRVRVAPASTDSIGNHEEGLWGSGPDERIHHALSRVQGMLGRTAVVTAAIGGGRTEADRATMVPWGDRVTHRRAPQRPWPGRLPSPAPTTVFEHPHPVTVFTASGEQVTVDDRGRLSGPPATISGGRSTLRITAWAGPWPVDERWWDADAARQVSRFQVVDATGVAWLLVLRNGQWWTEARYD